MARFRTFGPFGASCAAYPVTSARQPMQIPLLRPNAQVSQTASPCAHRHAAGAQGTSASTCGAQKTGATVADSRTDIDAGRQFIALAQ
ncbi:hypothetical protein [Caballeronia sp. 15711]|uniref:hypothetical protein n=1 Tax=Caballeronia sp. 15711 TaxID=3391029 RepID=UPI0039E306A5